MKGTKGTGRDIHPGMLEKYYHSRGAMAYEAGRFDQAIRFLRKALSLEDQAYTRSHLSLVYEGKGDQKRALEELTRAIRIMPTNAEYYFRRSTLWRRLGDSERADEDYAAAVEIDPNLRRLEAIREALRKVEQAFTRSERDERLDHADPHDRRLKGILARMKASREERLRAFHSRSCLVNCPAFCCYFSKDLVLHGVLIGPWKLQAIRECLRKKHLREEDFIERFVVGDEALRLRLIPPDLVITEKNQRVVFSPKGTDKRLGADLAQNLPVGRGYTRINWMTEESAACAFLTNGRCAIHDLADEPALPACKEFFCLTGFVFLALANLGALSREEMEGIGMDRSNSMAIEAALLLARAVYEDVGLSDLEARLAGTIGEALEADKERDGARLTSLINRCRRLERLHAARMDSQVRRLRNEVVGLLAGKAGPEHPNG